MPHDDELLTTNEVAVRFKVTVSSVSRWVRSGRLHAIRTPGGGLRVRSSEVEALLDRPATAKTVEQAS